MQTKLNTLIINSMEEIMKKIFATVAVSALLSGAAYAQNISFVDQVGVLNSQGTAQAGSNIAATGQYGGLNNSFTGQAGGTTWGPNASGTVQIGAFNNSITTQMGDLNAAATLQAGVAGHFSSTSQAGLGNNSLTVQVD